VRSRNAAAISNTSLVLTRLGQIHDREQNQSLSSPLIRAGSVPGLMRNSHCGHRLRRLAQAFVKQPQS